MMIFKMLNSDSDFQANGEASNSYIFQFRKSGSTWNDFFGLMIKNEVSKHQYKVKEKVVGTH